MSKWFMYSAKDKNNPFIYDESIGASYYVLLESTEDYEVMPDELLKEDVEKEIEDYALSLLRMKLGNVSYFYDFKNEVPMGSIPKHDEKIINQRKGSTHIWRKVLSEGKYDIFVHYLNGEFYGAWKDTLNESDIQNGYSSFIYFDIMKSVYRVNNDGEPLSQQHGRKYLAPGNVHDYIAKGYYITGDNKMLFAVNMEKPYNIEIWAKEKQDVLDLERGIRPYLSVLRESLDSGDPNRLRKSFYQANDYMTNFYECNKAFYVDNEIIDQLVPDIF